ncbi:MAG TPA: ABC transporter permease [Beutenbergiaceae bacterium]|nr:ABC transporter permease [Beutenbergiaceae bacterium]
MSTQTRDTPSIEARTPGPRAWLALTGAELKMVARDTAGLLIPIGLPLLILVTSAMGDLNETVIPGTGGRTPLDLFVIPVVVTLVLTMVAVVNMPSFLSSYRKSGVLRRLSVTPASPLMVLVAQVVVCLLLSTVGIAIALAVAMAGFGANVPVDPLITLGVLALTAVAMNAVGMLVAAVAPTPSAALALGLVLFLIMAATGGMFGQTENLPGPIATIGEHLPFGAAVQAVGAAWGGTAVEASSLIALAVATVLSSAVAAKFFRWD